MLGNLIGSGRRLLAFDVIRRVTCRENEGLSGPDFLSWEQTCLPLHTRSPHHHEFWQLLVFLADKAGRGELRLLETSFVFVRCISCV